MKRKGEDLIFISRISKDGMSVIPFTNEDGGFDDFDFFTTSLSMSEGTFIASGINSFIVKLKAKISTSTNSVIGSHHWFHTLIGSNKAIGEYLSKSKDPKVKNWGKKLYENCEELIKGYKYINK